MRLKGFPPVADPSARILVLGSMPGVDSLNKNQYYAHKRNAFWKIMSVLCDFPDDISYEYRLENLKVNKIALWDVIGSCVRPGSLDSKIKNESIEVNDFESFFQVQTKIRTICFNGAMAEKQFARNVLPLLAEDLVSGMALVKLPSTSPAMASMTFEDKLAEWSKAIEL